MKTLFTKQQIKHAIELLAVKISYDYRNADLVVLGVLNGALYFTADLTRKLTVDHELATIKISSYNKFEQGAAVLSPVYLTTSLKGKDVLIIEDLVDSGATMQALLLELEKHEPKSVKVAALCYKSRSVVKPQYYCFEVADDSWLIGYGMDGDGKKRGLSYIYDLNR